MCQSGTTGASSKDQLSTSQSPFASQQLQTTPTPKSITPNGTPSSDLQPEQQSLPRLDPALKEKQDLLEMYYDAEDTTYQPNLANVWTLATQNFALELGELTQFVRRVWAREPPLKYTPPDCLGLTLSNEQVSAREQKREQAEPAGSNLASPLVVTLYRTLCIFIDIVFANRPIPRLWFLEVVARIPYFSYTSCLHLLATLGWWRSPQLMNIHHAEELNEAFHLSVMESLGGDKAWADRFLAYHAAILYYWFLVVLFFVSPTSSYTFSELLENHAVDTYGQFLDENAETLRALPIPEVAKVYFDDHLYYFDESQADASTPRRPQIANLYDVFENILLDEHEHVKTMVACREYTSGGKPIQFKGRDLRSKSRASRTPMTREERQRFWKRWTQSRPSPSTESTDS